MKSYGVKSLFASLVLATVALTALPACQTLKDPNKSLAAQIAVQYGAGKFIEAGKTPDAQVKRAAEVKRVAEEVKAATANESATVDTLKALALAKIAAADLAPSDRLLANTLVDVVVTELTARVQRVEQTPSGPVTVGVLSPDAKLAVHKVLDWIVAAASVYG